MTWLEFHRQSESLAIQAQEHINLGRDGDGLALFAHAAMFESEALGAVESDKVRTRGILGVSAVALWYKAGEYERACRLAQRELESPLLQSEFRAQLRELLEAARCAVLASAAGE